ncbi:translation initiation factor IF-2-like [Corvus kubaryi]|uniref:translation initiation factor IF-2-like n=1 Tax=Corvus kubaryi TaxID=68294 RepID=UPI001C045C61|nr:translation initiation factor IF-2-like [Corvus kubaryi]
MVPFSAEANSRSAAFTDLHLDMAISNQQPQPAAPLPREPPALSAAPGQPLPDKGGGGAAVLHGAAEQQRHTGRSGSATRRGSSATRGGAAVPHGGAAVPHGAAAPHGAAEQQCHTGRSSSATRQGSSATRLRARRTRSRPVASTAAPRRYWRRGGAGPRRALPSPIARWGRGGTAPSLEAAEGRTDLGADCPGPAGLAAPFYTPLPDDLWSDGEGEPKPEAPPAVYSPAFPPMDRPLLALRLSRMRRSAFSPWRRRPVTDTGKTLGRDPSKGNTPSVTPANPPEHVLTCHLLIMQNPWNDINGKCCHKIPLCGGYL